jgi:TP901 family phage tail tape measure protein
MVTSNFSYNSDFSQVTQDLENLVRQATQANSVFAQLNKTAASVKTEAARSFAGVANAAGFKATIVDLTGATENFGEQLSKNKLTMRQYFSEASKAYKKDSQAYKLAMREVRRANGTVVAMGDVNGRRKGMMLTPDSMDMGDAGVRRQIAIKQYEVFNDLVQKGSTSLVNWGKNTQWAGRQLTVGLTVPMGIFTSQAIKAFSELDKEVTRFKKVYGSDLTNAVEGATDKMIGTIETMGAEFAKQYGIASAQTMALAADLAAAGLEGANLSNAVNQTTRMMVLGEVDRQEAMKATLSIQTAFNQSSTELAQSIDFLNAVENQTSASLQDLTEAIPKTGPVIQALGGDIKDLSVLMTALREGGIAAGEGANAIKSGMASLISPTNRAIEVANQFGIDLQGIVTRNKGELMPMLTEFQGQLQGLTDFGKARVIEQVFGKYQFARLSALFDNLNQKGSQTVGMIKLMEMSADDLAKKAYSELKAQENAPSTRLAAIQQQLTEQMIKIGADLAESVLPPLQQGIDILSKIVDGFNNLPEPVKNFAKILGGIVAASGPIMMLAGMFGNFIGNAIKFGMSIVNMFKRITGQPVQQLQILTDQEMAAKLAAEQLTGAYYKQKTSIDALNKSLGTYIANLRNAAAVAPPASVLPGGRGKLPPVRRRHGGIIYAQNGMTEGRINGYGGGDKVPALLEPGEFVINKESSKKFAPVLRSINKGTYGQFSDGFTGVDDKVNISSPTNPVKLTQRPAKSKTLIENIGAAVKVNYSSMPTADVEATKSLINEIKSLGDIKQDSIRWQNQRPLSIPSSIAQTSVGRLAANMNDIIEMQKWMAPLSVAGETKSPLEMSASHAVGGGTARRVSVVDGIEGTTTAKNFVLTTRLEPQIANQQIQAFGTSGYSTVLDRLDLIQNQGLREKRDSLARLLSGTGSATTYSDAVLMSDFYDELDRNPALKERFAKTGSIEVGKTYYNNLAKLGPERYSSMTKSQWITSQLGALQVQGNSMSPGLSAVVGKPGAKPASILIDDLYKALDDVYERTIGKVLAEETKIIQAQAKKGMSAKDAARARSVEDAISSRKRIEQSLFEESQKVNKNILTSKEIGKLGVKTYDNPTAGNRGYLTSSDGKTIKIIGEPIVEDGSGKRYIQTSSGLIELDKNNRPIIDASGKVSPITRGMSVSTVADDLAGVISRPSKSGPKVGISEAFETTRINGHRAVRMWTRRGWVVKYLRKGGQLPGYGGGDTVPAMLEPGEFVINKEATKNNLPLLEQINNDGKILKRKTGGIIPGYQSGGQVLGSASAMVMNLAFLPMMLDSAKNSEGMMQKLLIAVIAIQGIVGAIQAAQLLGSVGKLAKGGAGKVAGIAQKASAGITRKGVEVAAKGGMARTALGSGLMNAGKALFGISRFLPGIGLAITAASVGFMLWRKRVDELAVAARQMYTQGTEMAKVYNIEINNSTKAMERNAKYARAFGNNPVTPGKGVIDKDYASAVTKDFGGLIDAIKGAGDEQAKTNMISAQYASLIAQGFGQERAAEITAEIARQAGATAEYAAILPTLTANVKEAGDAMSVIETVAVAQIESLGTAEERLSAYNAAFAQLINASTGNATQFVKSSNAMAEALQESGDLGQAVSDMFVNQGINEENKNKILNNLFGGEPVDWASQTGLEVAQALQNAAGLGLDITQFATMNPADVKNMVAAQAAQIKTKEELNKVLDVEIQKTKDVIDATNKYYDDLVEGIQKEIDAIEDGAERKKKILEDEADAIRARKDALQDSTDFYISQLEKEYKAEQYYQQQRETALGGLQSLSQGDVFGYLQAQQKAASDASQFGREQAIAQINETSDAAQKAFDKQLDRNQKESQMIDENKDNAIEKKQEEITEIEKLRNEDIRALKADLAELEEARKLDKVSSLQIDRIQKSLAKTVDGLPVQLDVLTKSFEEPFDSIGQNLVTEMDGAAEDAVAEVVQATGASAEEVSKLVERAFGETVPKRVLQATGFKINADTGEVSFSTAGAEVVQNVQSKNLSDLSRLRRKELKGSNGNAFEIYDSSGTRVGTWSTYTGFQGAYTASGPYQWTGSSSFDISKVKKYSRGGKVLRLNGGSSRMVPGFGNSDTVAALLTPGEWVSNKQATRNNLPVLKAMNAGAKFSLPQLNSYDDKLASVTNNSNVTMGGVNININGTNMSPEQLEKSVINALDKAASSIGVSR